MFNHLKKDIQVLVYDLPIIRDLYKQHKYKKKLKVALSILPSIENPHPRLEEYVRRYAKFVNYSNHKAVKHIQKLEKPYIRINDGDIDYVCGNGWGYQSYNQGMVDRLWEILESAEHKNTDIALAGFNHPVFIKDIIIMLNKLLNQNRESYINRLLKPYEKLDFVYPGFYTRSINSILVKELKKIWHNKDVCFVTSSKGSSGTFVAELFGNTKSVSNIETPPKDAFNVYDDILNKCKEYPKDTLFLVSLGSAAKILVYDLFQLGYKALDIGQLPAQYLETFKGAAKPELVWKQKLEELNK
jgi:hypothetical protein